MSNRVPPPIIYPAEDARTLVQSILTLINSLKLIYSELDDLAAGLNKVADPNRPESSIMRWLGDYVAGTLYSRGDVVLDGSDLYLALRNTSFIPSTAPGSWLRLGTATRTDIFSTEFSEEFA